LATPQQAMALNKRQPPPP